MFITLYLGVALMTMSAFIKEKWITMILSFISFGLYFQVIYGYWLPYLLFILGIILLIVEFYVPGFGIPGMLGIFATTYALYWYHQDAIYVLLAIAFSLFTVLITAFILSKMRYSISISPQFILEAEMNHSASSDLSFLVGKKGKAITDLRPVGRARFNNDIYDVLSEIDLIPSETSIYVERVEGSKIIVRKENK